jgi:hypothetical protein
VDFRLCPPTDGATEDGLVTPLSPLAD